MSSDAWYLLFTDSDRDYWLKPFLKIGFHHVIAIRPERRGYLVVENHYRDISVYTLQVIDNLLADANQIVKVEPSATRRPLFMLDTCVGTTKQMLGINKPFIWTPWQLYKYTKRLRDGQQKKDNQKVRARARV